jgi:hypothetical protein
MTTRTLPTTLTTTLGLLLFTAVLVLFMVAAGGWVVVLSFAVLAVTVLSLPVLWLSGNRRSAGKLLAGWGIYLVFYFAVSTGMALLQHQHTLAIGQEICADSGCFAVDNVDRTTAGQETAYTLSWHLASNDTQQAKHFPGKGLELYMFDERGRKFVLPDNANPNPLDVALPAGETVRQSMTFNVPADARELFLTAEYRPFTFQSLLPSELGRAAMSLVRRTHPALIRIQ